MDIKEAILFCEIHRWKNPRSVLTLEGFKNVEILLKRGEADSKELKKVWKMWEKLYKELDYHSGDAYYKNAKILADRIKQEFFPKE